MSAMGESEEITWEERDGKLIMDSEGEEVEAVIEDGELVMDLQGIELKFEKAK